jgi:clan AA aspartic protease
LYSGGRIEEIDVVIDTGFDGYLTLPSALIAALGMSYHSEINVVLGDGRIATLREFEARVDWNGAVRDVLVLEADGGALVGMALLYGSRVVLEVVDGGRVLIDGLSP